MIEVPVKLVVSFEVPFTVFLQDEDRGGKGEEGFLHEIRAIEAHGKAFVPELVEMIEKELSNLRTTKINWLVPEGLKIEVAGDFQRGRK